MQPHGPYSVPIVLPCVSSPFLPGSPLHALLIVVPFVAFSPSLPHDEPPVPAWQPRQPPCSPPVFPLPYAEPPHIPQTSHQETPVAHRLPFSSRLRQQVRRSLSPLVSSYWPPTLHVGQPSESLHSQHWWHAPVPLLRSSRLLLSEPPQPPQVVSGVPAWPDSSLSVCSPVPPVSRVRPPHRQELSVRPLGQDGPHLVPLSPWRLPRPLSLRQSHVSSRPLRLLPWLLVEQ